MKVNLNDFMRAMDKAEFTGQEIKEILTAGAAVVITTQKILVPKDTRATQLSVHMEEGENNHTVRVGPSTDYAPYIEYGTSNPNYPIQPFVVPSGTGKSKANAIKACMLAILTTLKEKGLR